MSPPGKLSGLASTLVCSGCRTVLEPAEPYPFRCPKAGDGRDHVVRRVLDYELLEFPAGEPGEPEPFVRYRTLMHSYHLATAGGLSDSEYVDLVRQLDAAVARVDGRGFRVTPFREEPRLAAAAGLSSPLLVKDETGNVAGSHKGRHLFGVLLHLEVAERLGLADAGERLPLAIASCGNAALAAAVVAAAGGRRLLVFVPSDADPPVLRRLGELDAEVRVCPREEGQAGDPAYHGLERALAAGEALAFTCQGSENGLAVEGGETLGYEMVSSLAASGRSLDSIVVQVGGGALASAVAAAFSEAVALGALGRAPRLHTVQTESAWPLRRAFSALEALVARLSGPDRVERALEQAARERSQFMWPWETTPRSVAHGILDDETYDWLAVCEAMLLTGGRAAVVAEEELMEANALALEATAANVDPTGSAGLAGLLRLREEAVVAPDERAAVLFTGARR